MVVRFNEKKEEKQRLYQHSIMAIGDQENEISSTGPGHTTFP